jgi:hypothetical protein
LGVDADANEEMERAPVVAEDDFSPGSTKAFE